MNADSPKTPREEMETWLTSLLLGELSAGEAAAVRELIKHDPELAKLHDQLKQTIVLVRETVQPATATHSASTEALQLSEERRKRLRAAFLIPPLKQTDLQPKPRVGLRLLELLAVLSIVAILSAMLLPSLAKSKAKAQRISVLNNLKQLDGAKAQWALENNKSAGATPTFDDIKPYLGRGEMPSVGGEAYVLGKVGEPTAAELSASDAKKTLGRFAANLPNADRSDRVRLTVDGGVSVVDQDALTVLAPAKPKAEAEQLVARTWSVKPSQAAGQTSAAKSDSAYFSLAEGAPAAAVPVAQSPPPQPVQIVLPSADVLYSSGAGAPVAGNPVIEPSTGLPVAPAGSESKPAEVNEALGYRYVRGGGSAASANPANGLAREDLRAGLKNGADVQLNRGLLPGDVPLTPPALGGGGGGGGGGAATGNALEEFTRKLDVASGVERTVEVPGNRESVVLVDPSTGLPIVTAVAGDAAPKLETREFAVNSAALQQALETAAPSDEAFRRRYSPESGLLTIPRVSVAGGAGGGGGGGGAGLTEPNLVPPAVVESTPNNDTLALHETAGVSLKGVDESKALFFGGAVQTRGATPESEDKSDAASRTRTPTEAIPEVTLQGVSTITGRKKQILSLGDKPTVGRLDTNSSLRGYYDDGAVSVGGRVAPASNVYSLDLVGYATVPVQDEVPQNVGEESAGRPLSRLPLSSAGNGVVLERMLPKEAKKVESAGKSLTYSGMQSESESLRRRAGADLEDLPVRKPATNAPIPQPEVLSSENAFSTFSLNVSDVSFKLAAASLEKGQMPDPASVRSEEFINAFDYRDPEPLPGEPIAFAWERARYPFAVNRDLLRFSLKTAAAGRQAGRPLNIVLLLDNSGSMERADRVQIIREALRVLASQLQPSDKLSVITFARTARLVADGVSGDKAGEVTEQVSGLTPQGGTNLEEAMNLAYQTAARHYLLSGINRVVLLTDGAANLGDVEPASLKQKVEAARQQGIALDCFGIGWEGLNDDLLEVLSRNGDGRYGFINSPEEAATEFAGQLAGALKVAASDVKVQVEFNPQRVTSYRQIGYAKHQLTKEQFRDNTVDAAEIAAQEAGNALYTVEVNPAGRGPLGTVRVRYKIPGTSDYREQAWEVPFTGNAPALEQSSPAMRLAASASAFAEWLVASPFAGEVTPDRVLGCLRGVPEVFGADSRPKRLEWMIRQARSAGGK